MPASVASVTTSATSSRTSSVFSLRGIFSSVAMGTPFSSRRRTSTSPCLRRHSFQLHEVRDGTIALDGGAMFGVVPRPLWEKRFPADERNRIPLAVRCLLIEDGPRKILVDDGIGTKWDGKHREMYGIDHKERDLD